MSNNTIEMDLLTLIVLIALVKSELKYKQTIEIAERLLRKRVTRTHVYIAKVIAHLFKF